MSFYLFISYRRDDTRWIARNIHRYLSRVFGVDRVFMDRVEIRFGDNWEQKIEEALDRATVILPIIGPRWLELHEEKSHRRRIDNERDWVRTEIRSGLENKKKIVPLYVDGATRIVEKSHLPPDLAGLIKPEPMELSESGWYSLLDCLVKQLAQEFGIHDYDPSVPMPERKKRIDPLTRDELEQFRTSSPSWRVTATEGLGVGSEGAFLRTELHRQFRFESFQLATKFMAETSPAIDLLQHHPRWENIWRTVRVWLSTWDIEFQPSEYDLRLARLLDESYETFTQRLRIGIRTTT